MASLLKKVALFSLWLVAAVNATTLSASAAAALAFDQATYVNGPVTNDPFYVELPANASRAAAGSLLKLEVQSDTSLFSLPPTSSLSRFIYQSKQLDGSLVPVSAYILWPYSPRKQSDGFAVVAWAHGTSGVCNECAPSHIRNLWQHFLAPYQLSMQGYVVVATDYSGMGVPTDPKGNNITHEYLASPSLADDVFYSVQAAQSAFPELSKDFVVIGHSEGGGAAWAGAQRQVTEPVKGYLGAVAVSPVTNVLAETGNESQVLGIAIAPGVQAAIPGFKISQIATLQAQAAVNQLFEYGGCSAMADAVLGPLVPSSLLINGWQKNPFLVAWQALVGNGGRQIAGPLLVFHGESDPLLNFNLTALAVANTVAKFPKSQIEFVALPDVSHVPALQASQPIWMDWIADRFAGVSVNSHSSTSTAIPARPSAAQQPELNWFVAVETEFFQNP